MSLRWCLSKCHQIWCHHRKLNSMIHSRDCCHHKNSNSWDIQWVAVRSEAIAIRTNCDPYLNSWDKGGHQIRCYRNTIIIITIITISQILATLFHMKQSLTEIQLFVYKPTWQHTSGSLLIIIRIRDLLKQNKTNVCVH